MKIRTRLALQFTIIVGSILILFSGTVYYFSARYRTAEFYERLEARSRSDARLFIEVQEVDSGLLTVINEQNVALPFENICIYNTDDVLIYSSDGAKPDFRKDNELIPKVRENNKVKQRYKDQEILGLLYNYKGKVYVIISSASDSYGLSKLLNLRLILIIGFLVCMAVTIFAARFYSKQALNPMSKVINQVGKIDINTLTSRVDEGNKKDEIALLSITFNSMLDRLETAFEMQKSFVSNASHELRTPLTVIRGQLEVTLLKDRNTEEYQEVLKSVKEDIGNLTELSNRLLDLARLSADSSNFEFSKIRIDELLWQARADLLKNNPGYIVQIDFANDLTDEDMLEMKGNEQLLKSAFFNLMENACKFSDKHEVNVIIQDIEGAKIIRFKDEGMGIPPEEILHIFEPFYRTENAKTIQGHGLGLPLTQRIVQRHNGRIEVDSVQGKGTVISLIFNY